MGGKGLLAITITQSNYDEMGLVRPNLGQKKVSWPENGLMAEKGH